MNYKNITTPKSPPPLFLYYFACAYRSYSSTQIPKGFLKKLQLFIQRCCIVNWQYNKMRFYRDWCFHFVKRRHFFYISHLNRWNTRNFNLLRLSIFRKQFYTKKYLRSLCKHWTIEKTEKITAITHRSRPIATVFWTSLPVTWPLWFTGKHIP